MLAPRLVFLKNQTNGKLQLKKESNARFLTWISAIKKLWGPGLCKEMCKESSSAIGFLRECFNNFPHHPFWEILLGPAVPRLVTGTTPLQEAAVSLHDDPRHPSELVPTGMSSVQMQVTQK